MNDKVYLQLRLTVDKNGVSRVDTAPHGMKTPTLVSDCLLARVKRHSEKIRSHPRVRNPSIRLQLGRTGDENGGPPGRYRPARCGNPKLGDYHLIMEQLVAEFRT